MGISKYFIIFAVACVLGDWLTRRVRALGEQEGVLDEPGDRRLHTRAVPRLGGIAIFLSFQFCLACFFLWDPSEVLLGELGPSWWVGFLIASSFLFVVGLSDDLFGLRPIVKLSGQLSAVVLIFCSGTTFGDFFSWSLPLPLDFLATALWLLLITNAFNLIDGLDGLASGLAIIASFGLIGIAVLNNRPQDIMILLAFSGAVLGFLRHNFHPASIFLGDVGSMFLGFTLGVIALENSAKSSTLVALLAPMLAFGVPLFDTVLAIWRRSVRRFLSSAGGVMSADMEHLHHRLVRSGLTQQKVALALYALSFSLMIVGLLSLSFQSKAAGIYLLAFVLGLYVVVRHLVHVELWDSGAALIRGISRPKSATIATLTYPVIDAVIFILSAAAAIVVVEPSLGWQEFRFQFLAVAPFWVGLSFCAQTLAQTYSRVWSQARVAEYIYLVSAQLLGVLVSLGIWQIVSVEAFFPEVLFSYLYLSLSTAAIVGFRSFPRLIMDLMNLYHGPSSDADSPPRRMLVLGANKLFFRHYRSFDEHPSGIADYAIEGILDADRNLRKRIVFGYRVLGTPSELKRILVEHAVDAVVIADSAVPIERVSRIVQRFNALNRRSPLEPVNVFRWQTQLEPVSTFETEARGTPLKDVTGKQGQVASAVGRS